MPSLINNKKLTGIMTFNKLLWTIKSKESFNLNKMLILLTTATLAMMLMGCSGSEMASIAESDNFSPQRKNNPFLAYTHAISIETTEQQIEKQYTDTIKTCSEATEYKCIILETELNTSEDAYSHIKLRVSPNAVNKIIQISAKTGDITSRSTNVEDLGKPIIDNKKRRSMLETHRARLVALQKRADNDIDSLIKISSELSKIQAELEKAQGQNALLTERIELDLVNITFNVGRHKSF